MSITQQRVVFLLVCAVGVYSFAGPSESHGGIWQTISQSKQKASTDQKPSRNELRAFFTDERPSEPDSFQLVGNEVSIESPPDLPEESTPAPAPLVAPVPDVPPVAGAETNHDFCTSGCSSTYHTVWCRHQQFWAHQSELSRERRLKNSRNLFKKSYYETFPAYHVENYGIYRTCWRKLPELDCCPEDEVQHELVPPPAHSH